MPPGAAGTKIQKAGAAAAANRTTFKRFIVRGGPAYLLARLGRLGVYSSDMLEEEGEGKGRRWVGGVQGQREQDEQSKQRSGASLMERRSATVIFPACVRASVWAAWRDM